MSTVLSPSEEAVMTATMKAAMLRAAKIIDGITNGDVETAQAALYAEGVPLLKLAKIDRALLASCHLRACAELGEDARISTDDVRRRLER